MLAIIVSKAKVYLSVLTTLRLNVMKGLKGMNKKEFIKSVQDELKKKEIKVTMDITDDIIDCVCNAAVNGILKGEEIPMGKLGKIVISKTPEREYKNLTTGETFMSKSHNKATFRFATKLKQAMKE